VLAICDSVEHVRRHVGQHSALGGQFRGVLADGAVIKVVPDRLIVGICLDREEVGISGGVGQGRGP